MRVGFVGPGHMGAPISRHILVAGHDLEVHDPRRPTEVSALVERASRRPASTNPSDDRG
jgi:3-hydroxyisobutyrate dehydrogenase-like beta-hydroxyacid dehydrogenase